MAADRGRRRIARGDGKGQAPRRLDGLQLAAGVRLVRARSRHKLAVLVCADGRVQLNDGALAILSLCDGTRSREQVVEQAVAAKDSALASEINAFIDAARARGWIVLSCE